VINPFEALMLKPDGRAGLIVYAATAPPVEVSEYAEIDVPTIPTVELPTKVKAGLASLVVRLSTAVALPDVFVPVIV
jgi:hypothetical protein